MPIETISLENKNTSEKSLKTEDNSENKAVSIKFNTKDNTLNSTSNSNTIVSESENKAISKAMFETKNNVNGEAVKSHETQANKVSFDTSSVKKEQPSEEEGFFSKMGSSIKHFFYGSASTKVDAERKELKDILSNEKSSISKLLDTMEKEDPSNVALVKNMLLSIDKVDSSNTNWKNKPMNPTTEKALITVVEKFKEQIRKSDSKLDPEISSFVNKLDSTKLLEKMEEREEDFHKFNVSINKVVEITKSINTKIKEIRKTDPEIADFLQSLVDEFKNYEKNPAMFIMYGQYMKNVLSMVQNSDLKTLQNFNDRFQVVFEKIKLEITSKNTDTQKKQTIMTLINENKDIINFDILEGKSATDEKIKLSEIIQDIFERPESYISRNRTSIKTDSSKTIVSAQKMATEMMGTRIEQEVDFSASTTPPSNTSEGEGGKFISALSSASIHEIKHNLEDLDNLSVQHSGVKVIEKAMVSGAFEFIRHLDKGEFEKCKKTINSHLKDEIKDFSFAMNAVKTAATAYKIVNNDYYKEYDKFAKQLEIINELFKANVNMPDNSDSLEEDKKTLDELIKKAQEKEDLMDLSINFGENDFNIVSLLENLRNIIVDLDLSLRSIKNKTDSKIEIDKNFLKNLKENEKRFKKIDQVREIMNKIFKSSKEVNIVNVSDRVKRATFKSDLKVLGLAIQELSAMGVRG